MAGYYIFNWLFLEKKNLLILFADFCCKHYFLFIIISDINVNQLLMMLIFQLAIHNFIINFKWSFMASFFSFILSDFSSINGLII